MSANNHIFIKVTTLNNNHYIIAIIINFIAFECLLFFSLFVMQYVRYACSLFLPTKFIFGRKNCGFGVKVKRKEMLRHVSIRLIYLNMWYTLWIKKNIYLLIKIWTIWNMEASLVGTLNWSSGVQFVIWFATLTNIHTSRIYV